MKYSTLVLALAATISAQSISDLQATIPQCARSCLAAAVASSGCSATDFACQCGSSQAAIKASATACITSALGTATGCSIPDALMVQPIADKICAVTAAMPASMAPASSSSMAAMAPASSMAAVSSSSMAVAPVSSAAPISQISDGQIQATSAVASAHPSSSGTYSTVYTTQTYTITSCGTTVTACPVGKVTTEVVSLYTTFCPYTSTAAAASSQSPPAASSPASSWPAASSLASSSQVAAGSSANNGTSQAPAVSSAKASTTAAPINPQTSAPAVVGKNSTMVSSGKATPTTTPLQVSTGAASSLKVGGFLGAVAAVAAFAL